MKHIWLCWFVCTLTGLMGMAGQRYIPPGSAWFIALGFCMGIGGSLLGVYYSIKLRE